MQRMGQQRHHRVEPDQPGRGALDGAIRPLPLRFEAKVGPALLEGCFNGPSVNTLLHNRSWPVVESYDQKLWMRAKAAYPG
jgi:hypothetical protein